jgi:hypothetical protein
MTQITINSPVSLVEAAQCLGQATEQDLSEVLIDTLKIMILPYVSTPLTPLTKGGIRGSMY